jgi:hypothetical protein
MNVWLLCLALVSAACLVVQAFGLDDRLDGIQPGDDGCWLDTLRIAGWLSAFAIYAVVNLFVF